MAEPTQDQIIAGARAYDRMGLRAQGWSDDEIETAMAQTCEPSSVSLEAATVILHAALSAGRNYH